MTARYLRTLLLILAVWAPARVCLGRNASTPFPLQQKPASLSGTTTPANGVPSIGDLMTVIDKATADGTQGRDWSTPVKLVIIFT
ncbi:MAG TPA: hypothetical protein VMW24_07110, partial [Sedimentisphaerales bacterium]|nr:hypothetical protein [Sedimentisphaerales bacterium]